MRFVNSKAKITALLFVIIFGILSLSDYAILTLNIPDLDRLEITQGVVKKAIVNGVSGRSGQPFILVVDGIVMKFNCSFVTRANKSCVDKKQQPAYVNKLAKVWWYEANIFGFLKVNRLLQLEIDNKLVVVYDQQKQKYLQLRSSYSYKFFIFFTIALILFLFMQFSSNNLQNIRSK